MKNFILLLSAAVTMVGCANQNSIYRTFDISKGESPMVDIRQRAILVSPNKIITEHFDKDGKSTGKTIVDKGMAACAEPSPDAMASLAYELAAKGGVQDKASGELGFAMHDSAAFTGLRTQSIQLLRDFGYRLCEGHLSGAFTDAQYDLLMRRYEKNTVALLAIEQLTGTVKSTPIILTSSGRAEATKSLSEQRAEREKIGDQIADLEKQKESLKKKRDEAKTVDATEIDGKIADVDGKVARLKGDRDVVDKAITDTKGVIAEGRTDVMIKADTLFSQRSDEHLQKVADVVSEIVNNIVLSDDENQICLAILQSEPISEQQKALSALCLKKLDNQEVAKKIYIDELKIDFQNERGNVSGAQSAAKSNSEKKLEHMKKLKEIKKLSTGIKTYGVKPTLSD